MGAITEFIGLFLGRHEGTSIVGYWHSRAKQSGCPKIGAFCPLTQCAPKSSENTSDAYSPVHRSQYLALNPLPAILSCLSPLAPSSQQLRSKAIYTLSGVLNHNAAAISLFEASGGWDTLRDAFSGTVYRIHQPTPLR